MQFKYLGIIQEQQYHVFYSHMAILEKDHTFLSYPPHLDQPISIIHKIGQQRPSFIILVL